MSTEVDSTFEEKNLKPEYITWNNKCQGQIYQHAMMCFTVAVT